jgi:transposase
MKQSCFLLLKNPDNLTAKERPGLKPILGQNQLLASAYLLKEYLKRLWQYKYTKSTNKFLRYWYRLAKETKCRHLINFSKAWIRYSYGLIKHCKFPIHTNRLEGINNKICSSKEKPMVTVNDYLKSDESYFSHGIYCDFVSISYN